MKDHVCMNHKIYCWTTTLVCVKWLQCNLEFLAPPDLGAGLSKTTAVHLEESLLEQVFRCGHMVLCRCLMSSP